MSFFEKNISGSMNFIKRRFSSTDIPGDVDDEAAQKEKLLLANATRTETPPQPSTTASSAASNITDKATSVASNFVSGLSINTTAKRPGPSPSAPTSPNRGSSMSLGSMQGFAKGLLSVGRKDNVKNLLVIDEPHTDWSKYFRGKKIFGDWDLRVEQAEFSEISIISSAESGAIVDIVSRNPSIRPIKAFRPDFVLVRQRVRNACADHRAVIIGLQYAGVPSVNTLHSIYNFLDKPWLYARLLAVQQKLGREVFPLIDQIYFFNARDPDLETQRNMLTAPKLPAVVKVGHAHAGLGKLRVEDQTGLNDATSVMMHTRQYATTEPFIEAKYDIHVQKIGSVYKAFMRKSISGNWKANIGSAMLEQISMNERFKLWVDECSQMYGGLDIVSIEAIQGKDGCEYIIEVNDCCMNLLGESQEDDRRQIANVVLQRMTSVCAPTQQNAIAQPQAAPPPPPAQQLSISEITKREDYEESAPPPPSAPAPVATNPAPPSKAPPTMPHMPTQPSQPSHGQLKQTAPPVATAPTQQQKPPQKPPQPPAQPPLRTQQSLPHNYAPPPVPPPKSISGNLEETSPAGATDDAASQPLPIPAAVPPPPPKARAASVKSVKPTVGPVRQPPDQSNRTASLPNHQQPLPTGGLSNSAQASPRGTPVNAGASTSRTAAAPSRPGARPQPPPHPTQAKDPAAGEEGEDTMKNLRKTFAGIFGDM